MLVTAQRMLAQYVLAGGMTLGLVAAMWLLDDAWLPFLGLLIVFVGSTVMPGSRYRRSAGAVVAMAAWMTRSGIRSYPLLELCVALALGVVFAGQFVHTLYTSLLWSFHAQQKTNQLLKEARNHRGELNRTLRSLGLAYDLLRRTNDELVVARRQAEGSTAHEGTVCCQH